MRLKSSMALMLLVGLLTPVSFCVALPHQHKQARQQIEELEQEWRAATLGADLTTMDRLLSEDYVGISWNGQVNTKAMQIDRLRNRSP